MSRLCRLRTKTHGEDGQWAYEEITKLREQVAAQAAEIESLRISYDAACMLVAQMHEAAMGEVIGPYHGVVEDVRTKVAAQAAVIETLTKRLASTNIIMEVVCAIHPDSACAKYELAENMNALALLTDSTQILAEVRLAERERVAERAEAYAYMSQNFIALAEEIRAME